MAYRSLNLIHYLKLEVSEKLP